MKRILFILLFFPFCLSGQVVSSTVSYSQPADPLYTALNDGSTIAAFFFEESATITTDANDSVLVWADYFGSGRNLLAADESRHSPLYGVDGITFGGDTSTMSAGFVWDDPFHYFIVFKQITWTANDVIIEGVQTAFNQIRQVVTTPQIDYRGSTASTSNSSDLALDTWGIAEVIQTETSDTLYVNEAIYVAEVGNNDMDGLIIGSGRSLTNFAHVCIKCVICRTGANTKRTVLYNLIKDHYGL